MKRKWLCTVLAALMTFGFAACGEEELANSSSHGASDSTPSASVPDTPDPPENPGGKIYLFCGFEHAAMVGALSRGLRCAA